MPPAPGPSGLRDPGLCGVSRLLALGMEGSESVAWTLAPRGTRLWGSALGSRGASWPAALRMSSEAHAHQGSRGLRPSRRWGPALHARGGLPWWAEQCPLCKLSPLFKKLLKM